MADDLKDLGSNTSLFEFEPNWISEIKSTFDIARFYLRFPGGVPYMTATTDFTPVTWAATYDFQSQEEQCDFLYYLGSRSGNAQRFWNIYPRSIFNLKLNWSSTEITCIPNDFQYLYQGHERIFVLLKGGDLLTRQVISAEYQEIGDNLVLTVNDTPPSEVEINDVAMFGMLYLVRFDQIRFKLNHHNDALSKVELSFLELNEYEDSDL